MNEKHTFQQVQDRRLKKCQNSKKKSANKKWKARQKCPSNTKHTHTHMPCRREVKHINH